ncbi:MAG: AraC family transcriptional regulator [Myxococcota bacterium]
MDLLSNIVSLLHPHDCVAAGIDAGGRWAVRFGQHAGLKCNAILKGQCWLRVEGCESRQLEAGDCVILPKGRPFLLSSCDAGFDENSATPYVPIAHGGTATFGAGGEFFMTGSRFLLSGPAAPLLLEALPPAVVVRRGPEQEAVQWSLTRIADELRQPRPGGALSIAHLSHFVFIQAMRRYLEEAPRDGGGWLSALADPALSRAVAAMHESLSRSWTVQDLAAAAGMSRTAFATRFRRVTGQTPMAYLTRWRMLFAAAQLRDTEASVAEVAETVGYTSESAFAVAFKREMSVPPRRYARKVGGS